MSVGLESQEQDAPDMLLRLSEPVSELCTILGKCIHMIVFTSHPGSREQAQAGPSRFEQRAVAVPAAASQRVECVANDWIAGQHGLSLPIVDSWSLSFAPEPRCPILLSPPSLADVGGDLQLPFAHVPDGQSSFSLPNLDLGAREYLPLDRGVEKMFEDMKGALESARRPSARYELTREKAVLDRVLATTFGHV